MKIMMFDVVSDEIPYIKELKGQYPYEVATCKDPLNAKTLMKAKDCDAITTQSIPHDAAFYQKTAQMGIKHIDIRHTGYEIVNLPAADQNKLVITNVPAYSPRSVSEMVLAHVFYLLRKIGIITYKEQHHNFMWSPDIRVKEIHNLTIGVIGTGHIGSTVARLFKLLGCKVLANDIHPTTSLEATVKYVSKPTLLKNSDIVTMHTPLDKTTHHLIGAKQFQMMKDSAIFINASRGGVVDTPALVKALDDHEIAAAGLDTLENELAVFNHKLPAGKLPNPYIHNLMKRPNVLLTPHVAFYTDDSIKNSVKISFDNILQSLTGQHVVNQVNNF